MLINNKKLPKREDWNENTNMMVSLKADPFSRVSDDAEIFLMFHIFLMGCFLVFDYRSQPKMILLTTFW